MQDILDRVEDRGQLVDVLLRQGVIVHQGVHHQPQPAAVDPVQESGGLLPAGFLPADDGGIVPRPPYLLPAHRLLALQPGQHGDDGVLRPARVLLQGTGVYLFFIYIRYFYDPSNSFSSLINLPSSE